MFLREAAMQLWTIEHHWKSFSSLSTCGWNDQSLRSFPDQNNCFRFVLLSFFKLQNCCGRWNSLMTTSSNIVVLNFSSVKSWSLLWFWIQFCGTYSAQILVVAFCHHEEFCSKCRIFFIWKTLDYQIIHRSIVRENSHIIYRLWNWRICEFLVMYAFTLLYHQEEFRCHLEGLRVTLEIMVHLCSHRLKNPNDLGDFKGMKYKL